MDPFFLKNEQYYVIKDWNSDSLIAGFTTKNGGESKGEFTSLNLGFHVHDEIRAVCNNRETIGELLHVPVKHWVGAEQTHDVNIVKAGLSDRGKGAASYEDSFKGTDGFFTREAGILLTMCYADCVPIYFYAPKAHAIGVAHAGWKGTVKGIGSEMIKLFKEENIDPQDIFVAIGPSICENCYIVDNRVIDLVQNILEDVEEKPYNLVSDNQYRLNLKNLNRQILKKSGVPDENIQVTSLCTSCQKEQFFSHRRDKGNTGRMMSFIGWKED
jgi:polyphenol oxidase